MSPILKVIIPTAIGFCLGRTRVYMDKDVNGKTIVKYIQSEIFQSPIVRKENVEKQMSELDEHVRHIREIYGINSKGNNINDVDFWKEV